MSVEKTSPSNSIRLLVFVLLLGCAYWSLGVNFGENTKLRFSKETDVVETERAVEFVFIFSRRRSGSSSLAQKLAENGECLFNMNEMFNSPLDPQHGEYKHEDYFRLFPFRSNENISLLQYLRNQNNIFCTKFLPTVNPDAKCRRCIGVVKIFDQPNFGQMDPESRYFKQFQALIGLETSLSIVLHRDPAQQECSLKWASVSGDWGICPTCHTTRIAVREKFYSECPKVASQKFQRQHDAWFDFIQGSLKQENKWYLDTPFGIHRRVQAEQAFIADVLKLVT